MTPTTTPTLKRESKMKKDIRKKIFDAIEPLLWEAKQRCNWWEPDYNENAHVEITLTIADVRRLFRVQQLVNVVEKENENEPV